jgi:hypothetical protein
LCLEVRGCSSPIYRAHPAREVASHKYEVPSDTDKGMVPLSTSHREPNRLSYAACRGVVVLWSRIYRLVEKGLIPTETASNLKEVDFESANGRISFVLPLTNRPMKASLLCKKLYNIPHCPDVSSIYPYRNCWVAPTIAPL